MVGPPRFRVDLSGMRERAIAREEYDREYRLVSGTRTILHLAAATNPGTRRLFQLVAVLRKRSAKTFNPKVVGSIPTRPIKKGLQNGTLRHLCRARCSEWQNESSTVFIRQTGKAPSIFAAWSLRSARSQ